MAKYDLKPYEIKILELREKVAQEARNLQGVLEERSFEEGKVRALAEKQARLEKENNELLGKIKENGRILEETIERQSKFVDSIKQEGNKEGARVEEMQKDFFALSAILEEMVPVVNEVRGFIEKEKAAQDRYGAMQGKLNSATQEYGKLKELTKKEKEELKQEKKELDKYHEYLKEFSGRLTYHKGIVKESTEFLNQKLEDLGVPLSFGLPPDRITTIPFQ